MDVHGYTPIRNQGREIDQEIGRQMKRTICILFLFLYSCSDSYRYKCQDFDHFQDPECQKPRCLFTQTCPEYLTAPVLEKQVESVQQPSRSQTDGRRN